MTFAKAVLIPTTVAIVGIFAAVACGVRLNVTPSVPTGLYLQKSPGAIERGQLVVTCLDPANEATADAIARGYLPAGDCPGGVAPLLKPVAAMPGDRITLTATGLAVNGVVLPGTVPRVADPQGRPLPQPPSSYTVPAGSVLLLVGRSGSFDGRYFGPVPVAGIRAQAAPLLLF